MSEPISAVLTSAGTAIQDYMTSLATWCASMTNFTRSNVVGSPVTSFTLTHNSLSFQLNFRVSAGNILMGTAPVGGVTDSATPGTPTGWEELVAILGTLASPSTSINVSEEFDAFTFLIKHSSLTYFTEGFHIGKSMVPNFSNDADRFIDGHVMAGGVPNTSNSSTAAHWFTTATSRTKIRVGENTWWEAMITSDVGTTALRNSPQGERPNPMPVCADSGSKSTSTSPRFGHMKYLFMMGGSNRVPLSVKPAATGNQGYMHINRGASASITNTAIRWNSAVTP